MRGGGKDTAPGGSPGPGLDAWPQIHAPPPPHGTLGPLRGPERLSTALTSPLPVLPLRCAASHSLPIAAE